MIFLTQVRAEDAAAGLVNRRFEREGVPAHLYNLAYVFPYQIKDALILREAMQYQEPDVILYALTLSDFRIAPVEFGSLPQFFVANIRALERFAAEKPESLTEPLERQREAVEKFYQLLDTLGVALGQGEVALGLDCTGQEQVSGVGRV